MAAKINDEREREHFAAVVAPAVDEGVVEFLGEVGSSERDELFAGALATVMLGPWPEPFGLVAIESMATGTPVIARRAGALPEIVEEGRTGFLVDDVQEARLALDRVGDYSTGVVSVTGYSPDSRSIEWSRTTRPSTVTSQPGSPLLPTHPGRVDRPSSTRRASRSIARRSEPREWLRSAGGLEPLATRACSTPQPGSPWPAGPWPSDLDTRLARPRSINAH